MDIPVLVLALVFGLAAFAIWLCSLIHCIFNKRLDDSTRIIGVILILVLGLLCR